jgi:hypothetical protein
VSNASWIRFSSRAWQAHVNIILTSISFWQILYGHYFAPNPTSADQFTSWKDVQKFGFAVVDENKVKELLLEAMTFDLTSVPLERPLLIIEAFRQSCVNTQTSIATKIFSVEKGKAAVTIFVTWVDLLAKVLDVRLREKEPVADTVANYLLIAILNLIADCRVVQKKSQLEKLRERGIDWENTLAVVSMRCSFVSPLFHQQLYLTLKSPLRHRQILKRFE